MQISTDRKEIGLKYSYHSVGRLAVSVGILLISRPPGLLVFPVRANLLAHLGAGSHLIPNRRQLLNCSGVTPPHQVVYRPDTE